MNHKEELEILCLNPSDQELLPEPLLNHIVHLHRSLEKDRQLLLKRRHHQQQKFDQGELPQYVQDHPAQLSKWQVAPIPHDLQERRVEITGPINSAKMVINMLNPSSAGFPADMAMLDFEDSMCPTWENVLSGVRNYIGVAHRDLTFQQGQKTYSLEKTNTAHPMVRVRGLHLDEAHVLVDGEAISAGLFDLVTTAYHTAKVFLADGVTPKYYVPKCEHFLEARWWNKLFRQTELLLGLEPGTLRVTFLIETLTAAYQMEEILYEIRERACGLNGGRWDKIFSDIKVLKNHGDRVLGDRATIDMKRTWMDNYAKRLIKICHRHGAFAMGGMSAFTPGKDEKTRNFQTEKVRADKAREAEIGHDGCWVSHPYFIPIARAEFTHKNQLHVQLPGFPYRPNLLPQPIGAKTIEGLRTNLRVGIAYMQGWNEGLGCIAFENLMEDLATLEISRAQTWQWLHHQVTLDGGTQVTPELIKRLLPEELQVILSRLQDEGVLSDELTQQYERAMQQVQELFLEKDLYDFFTLHPHAQTYAPQGGQYETQCKGTATSLDRRSTMEGNSTQL
ncbi:MAG: malate synthase A [Bdellovibrionaceae bacterium]|nr:malate synthase A [Bdellovibrionales bacterium]MCB9083634.1 malate synthase A [Pseudobdellovibrionaceae bacterium]